MTIAAGVPRENTRWIDWYGNLEATPPFTDREGRTFPFGRLVVGKQRELTMHPGVMSFLEAQGVQWPPIVVDTSWLAIGHADEVVNFLPARTAAGFKVLLPSPKAAREMLDALLAKGMAGATVFEGTESETTLGSTADENSRDVGEPRDRCRGCPHAQAIEGGTEPRGFGLRDAAGLVSAGNRRDPECSEQHVRERRFAGRGAAVRSRTGRTPSRTRSVRPFWDVTLGWYSSIRGRHTTPRRVRSTAARTRSAGCATRGGGPPSEKRTISGEATRGRRGSERRRGGHYLDRGFTKQIRFSIRNQILIPLLGIQVVAVTAATATTAVLAVRRSEREIVSRLSDVVDTLRHGNFPFTESVLERMRGLSGAHFIVSDRGGNVLHTSLPRLDRLPEAMSGKPRAGLSSHFSSCRRFWSRASLTSRWRSGPSMGSPITQCSCFTRERACCRRGGKR